VTIRTKGGKSVVHPRLRSRCTLTGSVVTISRASSLDR
jgi:hypothetical protein